MAPHMLSGLCVGVIIRVAELDELICGPIGVRERAEQDVFTR